MLNSNSDWLEQWQTTRQKGKWRHVWTAGVCWCGGMLTLSFGIANLIRGAIAGDQDWVGYIFVLVVCPPAGFLLGLVNWRDNEKKYRALSAKS